MKIKHKAIEPGILRIFRYFSIIAVVYFAFIATYFIISTGKFFTPSQIGTYLNLATFSLLSIYLSLDWLRRKLKNLYLPIALTVATVLPILNLILYVPYQQKDNLVYIITGSWSLFPILLVPLVLIAWQYGFRMVLVFTILTALIDVTVIFQVVGAINLETLPLLGVPFIRAFAFGTVGHIVARLMEAQKAQRKKLILANVKLAEYAKTQEQLAISRERNRIARELHDTLAHTLSGLTVNLEAIKLVLRNDPDEALRLVDEALFNTREGLTETRRALKALRPQRLEDLGLGMAIMNLAEDAAKRANAELILDIDFNLPKFPQETEQGIYRLTQEALQNIVKHAEAKHIAVHLHNRGRELVLEVRDDGKGITKAMEKNEEGLGLKGMKERAEMAGGKLEITSLPNKGTLVRYSLELNYDPNIGL
jgi:signal transduction histidine kinase